MRWGLRPQTTLASGGWGFAPDLKLLFSYIVASLQLRILEAFVGETQ